MGINLLGLWFLTSYLWNFLELSLVVGFTLSFRCVRQQPRPPCHLGLPWFALLSLFRLGPAQSDIMVPGSACTHHPARLPPGRRDSAWRTRFPPTPTGANSPGASAIDTDDRNLKPNNIMTRYDNLMTTFTTMKWNSFIDWRSPTINYIRSVRLMAWTRTHAECLAKSSQCLQEIRRQYSPTADLQWSCLNPLGFTQRLDIFSRLVAVDPWLGQPMAPPGMLELLIACGVFMVVNDNYIRYVYVYTYICTYMCILYYIILCYIILY